jgi:hypothetical protein
MALNSKLFSGDSRLGACSTTHSAHVTLGSVGDHVSKIQAALFMIDSVSIDSGELAARRYGSSTAAAVLKFKQKRNIINPSYQTQADNIVGKMTIQALDEEMVRIEHGGGPPSPTPDPRTDPKGVAIIQATLDRHRPGVRRMLNRTLEALQQVQIAFRMDQLQAIELEAKNSYAIDGLRRFFKIDRNNHEKFLPRVIAEYQRYLSFFPELVKNQSPISFADTIQQPGMVERDANNAVIKMDPAFSTDTKMFFTPAYREFDPNNPDVLFRGQLPETLVGIQIHEMGHFFFGRASDRVPTTPEDALTSNVSWQLLARQIQFQHIVEPSIQ